MSIPEPDTPQPLDIQQDWPLIYAEEANGKTIVRTSRAFDTNDPQDNPIIQVIFFVKDTSNNFEIHVYL